MPNIKTAFGGGSLSNEASTAETAQSLLDEGEADAAAFGKLDIANPDLLCRIEVFAPLNVPTPETFYVQGSAGYIADPALS